MEPIDYLRTLRRRWQIVVGCLVVAIAAAVLTAPAPSASTQSGTEVRSYTATHTLLLAPDAQNVNLSRVRLLVRTGEIPRAVDEELHFRGNAAELAAKIRVGGDDQVGTVTITTEDRDGESAAALANAFGAHTLAVLRKDAIKKQRDQLATLRQQLDSVERQVNVLQAKVNRNQDDPILLAQRDAQTSRYQTLFQQYETVRALAPNGGLTTLAKATPVAISSGGGFSAPTSRRGRLAFAGVLGLLLGLAGAFAIDRLDTRLRSRHQIEEAFRLPVLTEIPKMTRREVKSRTLAVAADPGGAAAESYRSLRSALLLLPSLVLSRPTTDVPAAERASAGITSPEVILVTSALPGEGKTTTLVNLASCLAEVGKSVLVLDCDFRKPDAHRYLDVPSGSGLSDLLVADRPEQLRTVVRQTAVPGVLMVTSGTATDHPAAFLAGMGKIINQARSLADVVLIDSAPVLGANDAVDLMPYADSLLLTCRYGRSARTNAARVSELVARMGMPALGVAVVGTARRRLRTSGSVFSTPNLRRRVGEPRRPRDPQTDFDQTDSRDDSAPVEGARP
jgi:Mrp family chromosome partitioning ATPase/capsular polysaccharide biosynthesis protein